MTVLIGSEVLATDEHQPWRCYSEILREQAGSRVRIMHKGRAVSVHWRQPGGMISAGALDSNWGFTILGGDYS